jgi:hypothetical protein
MTDICMREQDIACAASISPGEFAPQESGQLTPYASLAVTPVEYEYSADPQHSLVQVSAITTTLDLKAYIIETKVDQLTYYSCGYPGCGHKGRFNTRRQAISHIRCIHLKEKPFKCITWYAYRLPWATQTSVILSYSGTFFARRPDATRHVNMMNRGKIYECTVWYADSSHSLDACSDMSSVLSPVINATRVKISAIKLLREKSREETKTVLN